MTEKSEMTLWPIIIKCKNNSEKIGYLEII